MKGFALGITMLFLLLFAVLGFSLLLVAGSYYSSTRNLFEKENARIVCESATSEMVARHNATDDDPRFFYDPQFWQQQSMVPFVWNGYSISAELHESWNPNAGNFLTVSTGRGPFLAQQQLEVRQRRLEDFAFFTDGSQTFPVSPLFDGVVFARESVHLLAPDVRFRDYVQAQVSPELFASFKKKTFQEFNYPSLDLLMTPDWILEQAVRNGIVIREKDPLFWSGSSYLVDLDQLEIEQVESEWLVRYKGIEVGNASLLYLWFDDQVRIKQTDAPFSFLPSGKLKVPLYLTSSADIVLESNLGPVEGSDAIHPLCLIAAEAFYLSSALPRASRFRAGLIALGSDQIEEEDFSLNIEEGGVDLTPAQKEAFALEIRTSAFLLEEQKRSSFIEALENGEKVVWFRGSVVLSSSIRTSADLNQLHFEASRDVYPLLPSFPFVYIVEGSRQWR